MIRQTIWTAAVLASTFILVGCSSSESSSDQHSDSDPPDTKVDRLDTGMDAESADIAHGTDIRDATPRDTDSAPSDIDRTDTAPTDAARDVGDGSEVDSGSPVDASDTRGRTDAKPDVDTGSLRADTDTGPPDVSDVSPDLDTGESRDTTKRRPDTGPKCPPDREFRGLCSPTLYCCTNEALDWKCQYGSPCAVPEVLHDDPEWTCETC